MNADVLGVPVHYEEVGNGRPVLILHGSPNDHRTMMPLMEPLFEGRSGWRRLYPDLPGHGQTPGADWIMSQDDMLTVALGFLDSVAPDERFSLVGLSYGGYIGRGIVSKRRAQMDGAMFSAPLVEVDPAKRNYPAFRVIYRDAAFLAALTPHIEWLTQLLVVQSPDVLAEVLPFLDYIADADMAFLQRIWQRFAFSFDVDALDEPFAAPALFITGRFDAKVGYREAYALLDNYPRATFAVLDRAGHLVEWEQLTLFKALTSEWLDRVEEYVGQNSGT